MIRAYVDHQSVEPGETLRVHASGTGRADLRVRWWEHSDPNPRGPGVVVADCPWGAGVVQLTEVDTRVGSYGVARGVLPTDSDFSIALWHLPTNLERGATLIAWNGSAGPVALTIDGGRLILKMPTESVPTAIRLRERQWSFVGVSVRLGIGQTPPSVGVFGGYWGRTGGPLIEEFHLPLSHAPGDSSLCIGSPIGSRRGDLDGIVAGVGVWDAALDIVDLMDVMSGMGVKPTREWAMDDVRDADRVPSLTATAMDMELFNAPARSSQVPAPLSSDGHPLVRSGSVHFHTDDLEDCSWPVVQNVTIPADAASGFYTVTLSNESCAIEVPFIVAGRSSSVLLVPTLTWQAYGNLGRDPRMFPGRSHYSLHGDGSPVIVSTCLRPCPTLEPHARLEVDAGDGFADNQAVVTHLMMADLYAWHWLRTEGVEPVVMDDRALHANGAAALDGVRVLVLSAHPEYWTSSMLDALQEYIGRGGHVIYLGGNGLYWVTSLHPSKPHLMEVRRWGGSQTCSVEEVDRRHQFEDRLGGLWAGSTRPPNALVGVGFAGFGAGPSMTFERRASSYADEWAWAFDGVEGPTLGGDGINVGACNEFDSFSPALAPDGRSTILASSIPTSNDHFGVYEAGGGRAPADGIEADLVATVNRSGAMTLALSSITASGCLVVHGQDTPMKRLCSNFLHRMLKL